MARAQTIQIFLPNGDPTGLRMASIPTRTVQVFDVPRPKLAEFLERTESERVCIYILIGIDESSESPKAYIGQTGSAGVRLKQHNADANKDFWTRAVVAVSLTNEWTQTHVSFLEWESISLAQKAGRYRLANGNAGSKPHTPEPLQADCEEFLETIKQLISTLGYPVLETPKRGGLQSDLTASSAESLPEETNTSSTLDEGIPVYFRQRGADAEGVYSSDGLLVLAGSKGVLNGDLSVKHRQSYINQVKILTEEQTIEQPEESKLTFRRDHLFASPSTAAGVLIANTINGRTAWQDKYGRTIKALDDDRIRSLESGQR